MFGAERAAASAAPPLGVVVALVLVCLGLTVRAPTAAMLLAPLLLGVPHVLGDLWVLFFRPGGIHRVGAWIGPPLLALIALRAGMALGLDYPSALEPLVGTAAVLLGAASTRSPRRIGAAALLCLPVWAAPAAAALLLGHLHNAVAVGLLLLWGPRRLGLTMALLSLGGLGLIAAGVADAALRPFAGLDPASLVASLAPGLPHPWADRLVLAFCFGQLVHYLCWTALLPACLRDAGGPRRPLLRALRQDLGAPLLLLGGLGALALPLAGLGDPVLIRSGYLSVVLFHGWMELAALAAFRPTPPA